VPFIPCEWYEQASVKCIKTINNHHGVEGITNTYEFSADQLISLMEQLRDVAVLRD
jgi:hypothetical protein